MMGLLSRGSVQSYFYLFEGLGINSLYYAQTCIRLPTPITTSKGVSNSASEGDPTKSSALIGECISKHPPHGHALMRV